MMIVEKEKIVEGSFEADEVTDVPAEKERRYTSKPVIAQKTFMFDSSHLAKGGLTPSIKLTPKSINVSAITKVCIFVQI
jgi:hypothetical protein